MSTDLGQLDKVDGGWELRFTRNLPHPPAKVRRALTEPEHLQAWFPTDIEGERAPGAKLCFVFRQGEGPAIEGEMLAYVPPSLLELQCANDRPLGFELRAGFSGPVLASVE